jgi:hypothetical protein
MSDNNSSNDEFAAWVGIDWADQQHAVCLRPAGCETNESGTLPQSAEAIGQWAGRLRRRLGGGPLAVALEQSRGALISALMQYDFLVLFLIPAARLSRYR